MSLPELEQESYQHSWSEWVMRAGEALKEAGYLQTEPTGTYDEEFAAAVRAFQDAKSIREESRVGPFTWDALGLQESDFTQANGHSEDGAAQSHQVGAWSEDGHWQWDGAQWVPAAADQAHSADHSVQVDIPANVLSDDGKWRWDGEQWVSTEGQTGWSTGELLSASASANAGADVAGYGSAKDLKADSSDFEDAELADAIFEKELAILRQWDAALDQFNEVMESETQKTAKPDFAKVMINLFAEKIIGHALNEIKSKVQLGVIVDVVKGLVDEAERAKNAQKSVAFRDFYTTHRGHIADLDKELSLKKPVFIAAVRKEGERLLRNDPNAYGMLRMELMDLHHDVESRLAKATPAELFSALSAEWTRQSVQGEILIRINEKDLSIIDVAIKGPDGDKLVEHLTAQEGGWDVWTMRATKVIAYIDGGGNLTGWVRVDATNHLANLGGEQDGKYKKRYEQLVAQGGLARWTR